MLGPRGHRRRPAGHQRSRPAAHRGRGGVLGLRGQVPGLGQRGGHPAADPAGAARGEPPRGGRRAPPRGAGYRLTAAIFFSPFTTALKSEPGRNLGTDDLGTLMDAPVAGLRAVRAGRTAFSNTPNPVIETLSPLATAAWIVSSTAFTASVAVFLSPNLPEIASIRSRLFISSLLRFPQREVARTGH